MALRQCKLLSAFIRLGRTQNFNGAHTPSIPSLCVIIGDLAFDYPISAYVQVVTRSSAARPQPEIPQSFSSLIPSDIPPPIFHIMRYSRLTTRPRIPKTASPVQPEITQFNPPSMIPQWDRMFHNLVKTMESHTKKPLSHHLSPLLLI